MTENVNVDFYKPVIEGLLFISDKPVTVDQIKEVLKDVTAAEIKKALLELKDAYDEIKRGMTIMEIAGGYQMLSSPHYAAYIRDFFKRRVKEKLSRPALETLAIIAYKQPVSRGDIELIRGVNSDGVTINLLEKGLIKVVGRKDVPGKPYLYGTTKLFLEYFGLKSLRDLPKLEDFPALAAADSAVESTASEGGDQPPADATEQAAAEAIPAEEVAQSASDEEEMTAQEAPAEDASPDEDSREDSVVDLKRAMEEVTAEENQAQIEQQDAGTNRLQPEDMEASAGEDTEAAADQDMSIDEEKTLSKKEE